MLEHCVSVLDEKGGKNKAVTVYQPVWRMKTLPDPGTRSENLTGIDCVSLYLYVDAWVGQ